VRHADLHLDQLAGEPVTLDLTDPARPNFTAPQVPLGGKTLTFQLVVNDVARTVRPTQSNVTVTNLNHPPQAIAASDQTVAETGPRNAKRLGSFDPDGDNLSSYGRNLLGDPVDLD